MKPIMANSQFRLNLGILGFLLGAFGLGVGLLLSIRLQLIKVRYLG